MAGTSMERKGIVFWIMLIIILVIAIFPVYWIVITSFKRPVENISPVPTFFPRVITIQNYINVLKGGFFKFLFNSLFVASLSTLFSLAMAFLASYALVRHKFPFKLNYVFLIWVLVVKILPPIVLAIPLYTIFTSVHLINSRIGLVIVYQVYTLPYCLWMLFGFLKAMPVEFEQAAEIDGASKFKTLTVIVIPLTTSGIIATAIFSIIVAWDEFLFALLFIRNPDLLTLPLRIVNFITEYETLWGELMAIGLMATLPVLLFSGYVYKRMTEGFSLSLK
ncbi:MAG: carbohydrate ABC transporter permease [Spirochaetes bacterium]|nr:carbohydrate ABC transporter permease [Spirochaetota bacterium]